MCLLRHLQRTLLRKVSCCNHGSYPRASKRLGLTPVVRMSHSGPRSSSLFISNAVAQHTAAVQVELNLEARFVDGLEALRESLEARKMNYDVESLVEDYSQLCVLGKRKKQLEGERDVIANMMKTLVLAEKKTDDIEKSQKILIRRGKEVRETLKSLMPDWWQLEERVMLAALRLPNDLHTSTPIDEPVVLKQSGQLKDSVNSEHRPDHVAIGKSLGVLKFSDVGPTAYYLQGELTMLEQTLLSSVSTALRHEDFIHITCPEVLRTRVVEACGHDIHNPREVYTLTYKSEEEQKHEKIEDSYHLEGLSLSSFSAFLSKMVIQTSSLPGKYFALGRHYSPSDITLSGLYGARQSLRAHMFVGCANSYQCDEVKGQMEQLIWEIYSDFELPVRLVSVPAHSLHLNEQSRTEVQVWSPALQQFIQVAYIATVGDFVSQKLKIQHAETVNDKTGRENLQMVHGCAMNVTRLLAAFLEKTPVGEKQNIHIPERLRSHHFLDR